MPRPVDVVARARAIVEVTDAAQLDRCIYLGQQARSIRIEGALGRAQLLAELRVAAAERGASHVRYADHEDGAEQREVAHLYDCSRVSIAPPPSPLPAAEAEVSREPPPGWIAVGVDVLPAGSMATGANGMDNEVTLATATAISGSVYYSPTSILTVGFAPRFIVNLQGPRMMSPGTELDLLARVAFGPILDGGRRVLAYGTAGLSWVSLPEQSTASGTVLGFGAMALIPLGKTALLDIDVGYQQGDQTLTEAGAELDFRVSFPHLGIGFGRFF